MRSKRASSSTASISKTSRVAALYTVGPAGRVLGIERRSKVPRILSLHATYDRGRVSPSEAIMGRIRRGILAIIVGVAAIAAGVVVYRMLNPTPIEPPVAARPKESDIFGKWKCHMDEFPELPEGLTIIYEFREDKSFTSTTIAPPWPDDALEGTYEFDSHDMVLRSFTPTFVVKSHLERVERLDSLELILLLNGQSVLKNRRLVFMRVRG